MTKNALFSLLSYQFSMPVVFVNNIVATQPKDWYCQLNGLIYTVAITRNVRLDVIELMTGVMGVLKLCEIVFIPLISLGCCKIN